MRVKKIIAYDPSDLEEQINEEISYINVKHTNIIVKDNKFICFIFYEVEDE